MEGSAALLLPGAISPRIAVLEHLTQGGIGTHRRDRFNRLDGAIILIRGRYLGYVGSVTHLDFTLPRVIAKCGGRGQLAEDEAQQEQA
jgi:hypothetical protein